MSARLSKILGWVYVIILCLTPFLCTFIVEYACNTAPETIRVIPIVVEIAVCALLELILVGFIPFKSFGLIILYVSAVFFGAANFYLLKFRDIPFMFMDIKSAGTAFAVAKGYDFTPDKRLVISAILGAFVIILAFISYKSFKNMIQPRYSYVKSATIGLFSLAAMIVLIGFFGFSGTFGIVMNMWKPGLTYAENGAISSFISYAQFSTPSRPAGYSKKEVTQILKDAQKEYDETHESLESDLHPTIISIMDESYSDFSQMGPLTCNKDHLSTFYSLKNDSGTIWHGYSYVSTYAGGTARTEFEWLTGFSMQSFANAQPYSQFNFKNIMTSIRGLKKQGYETKALHPEKNTNYRRNTVYEQMRFDEFLSIDDFNGYKRSDIVPDRVSDSGNYARLIDAGNESEKPQFIHNVTMQNHGWYDFYLDNSTRVRVDGEYSSIGEFVRFQTLLNGSDKAVAELIDYYRNCDEPVIICLYGDHYPRMPEEFVTDIMAKGYDKNLSAVENEERRFKIPFFIWANYELPGYIKGYAMHGETITSPNYLGVVTRADAGLTLSAFDKYLLLLREKIPVINESGYVAGNQWHASDETTEYSELLNEYKCVQYAGMFDNKGIEELFY